MTKGIRVTDAPSRHVRDSASPLPRVTPGAVAKALGADLSARSLEQALAPVTLLTLRSELLRRLRPSVGQAASGRAKVPLGEADWEQLESLTAALSGPDFEPSPAQIASVLIALSVRCLLSQVGAEGVAPISRELAVAVAGRSS